MSFDLLTQSFALAAEKLETRRQLEETLAECQQYLAERLAEWDAVDVGSHTQEMASVLRRAQVAEEQALQAVQRTDPAIQLVQQMVTAASAGVGPRPHQLMSALPRSTSVGAPARTFAIEPPGDQAANYWNSKA